MNENAAVSSVCLEPQVQRRSSGHGSEETSGESVSAKWSGWRQEAGGSADSQGCRGAVEAAAGGCRGRAQVLPSPLPSHHLAIRLSPHFTIRCQAADGRLGPHAVVSDSAGSGRAPSVRDRATGVRRSAALPLARSGGAEAGFGTGPDAPGQGGGYGPCPVGCPGTGEIPDPGVILCRVSCYTLSWGGFL